MQFAFNNVPDSSSHRNLRPPGPLQEILLEEITQKTIFQQCKSDPFQRSITNGCNINNIHEYC